MSELKRVGSDDWELLREIRLRALADAPDAFSRTLEEAVAESESTWQDRARGPGLTLLAVDDAGRPVAMGGVFPVPDSTRAMVWGMWVDPSVRGHGLGRRILAESVAWARAAGRTAYLHVTRSNDSARGLYVSAGFVPTGESEPLREGSDLLVDLMVLPE